MSRWKEAASLLEGIREILGPVLSQVNNPPWDGSFEEWVEWADTSLEEAEDKLPKHYQKSCSMDDFKKNIRYFYKVKGKEWEGSKKDKLQRAVAASYSVLKRSCGVKSDKRMKPSEIVRMGEN